MYIGSQKWHRVLKKRFVTATKRNSRSILIAFRFWRDFVCIISFSSKKDRVDRCPIEYRSVHAMCRRCERVNWHKIAFLCVILAFEWWLWPRCRYYEKQIERQTKVILLFIDLHDIQSHWRHHFNIQQKLLTTWCCHNIFMVFECALNGQQWIWYAFTGESVVWAAIICILATWCTTMCESIVKLFLL